MYCSCLKIFPSVPLIFSTQKVAVMRTALALGPAAGDPTFAREPPRLKLECFQSARRSDTRCLTPMTTASKGFQRPSRSEEFQISPAFQRCHRAGGHTSLPILRDLTRTPPLRKFNTSNRRCKRPSRESRSAAPWSIFADRRIWTTACASFVGRTRGWLAASCGNQQSAVGVGGALSACYFGGVKSD